MKKKTKNNVENILEDRMKKALGGMIGLVALTPIATTAIGGLSAIGGGLGKAAQSIVSVGFVGHAAKLSGANKIFKW